MQIFYDGHSPAIVLYTYEDKLYISALSNEKLVEVLADCAINLEYTYVANLFKCYRSSQLGE